MTPRPAELSRLVGWHACRLLTRVTKPQRLATDDRRVLEDVVFQALKLDRGTGRILFVGCNEHTGWYPQLFRFGAPRFETVDPDPEAARHGAGRDHRVATLQELGRDARLERSFDAVVLNGVFNYGIDSAEQKAAAVDAVATLLRSGGVVVIGYRDRSRAPDVDLSLFDSERFAPAPIPGLTVGYHKTAHENDHAFACFRKR